MGRGVLLGVRVHVGMGVRETVGVAESLAMKVLLCAVNTARAVCVLLSVCAHEEDNVELAVASNGDVGVDVTVPDCVGVWSAIIVSVCVATDKRVRVQVGDAVEPAVGVKNISVSGWPKNRDPNTNSTSAREKASHCLPVVMRA